MLAVARLDGSQHDATLKLASDATEQLGHAFHSDPHVL
jgi:hypothetical protein